MKRDLYFIILVLIASLIIIIDNIVAFRHSYKVAEDTAKLQTLGIAVSLEAALKGWGTMDPRGNIFKDIINEAKWESITFIALYDKNGKIMLHSNQNLIGRTIKDSLLIDVRQEVVYGYVELGTGERVFTINMPVHTIDSEEAPVLRVAIHTHEMDKIRGRAVIKAAAMLVVVTILWLFAGFLWRALRRADKLQEAMIERERLAYIGEMSSVLAHEIRNPLGSIKGFAQCLFETADRQDDRDALDIIVRESARLERLTEDLLIYARPLEVKKGYFDLEALVIDTIKGFNDGAGRVSFFCETTNTQICSDRDKIRQALLNLLNNALDAMDNDGLIEIRLTASVGGAMLIVKDNGPGIDAGIAREIFKPFFTTKTKGTGLGLAIVRKICDATGGDIAFSSDKNGTEFRMFIRDLAGCE